MSVQAPVLDLSDIAEIPSPASVPVPARPPAGSYDANTEGDWSLERDAPKVKDWFRQTYGVELPVTAYGESATHRRRGLNHTNSMDVGINPTSERGQAFLSYLRQNNIPFLAYDRAVPGAATGAHVHVGFESRGLGAAPRLNLDDLAEPSLDLSDIAEKPEADDAPDVTINASAAPVATPLPSMPALPAQPAPDVMTTEGRAQRDALRAAESQPNARLWVDVHLPAGVRDWAQLSSNDVAKEGVRQWAAQRGIPSDFTEKWLADNGSDENLHLYDLATRKPLTTGEAMGREDIYDLNNRSFRLSAEMPQFKKLQDDYKLAQLKASGIPGMESVKSLDEVSPGLRALTVDSDETSPGEKFLDVAGPPAASAARGVARTADLVTRPLQALDAGFWAKVRGARDPAAVMAAYQKFFGGDPELGKNVIAEALRNSDKLRAINPRLPALLGELANIIVEPSNVALVGGTAAAAKLLRGTAAAERAGEAARGLGLMDRGFVEARPLGLGDAALGGSEPVEVAPRGGVPPVPENPAALRAQMEALMVGRRRAVLVTPGSPTPEVPEGFTATQTPRGVFIHDPAVVTPAEVQSRVAAGTHGELLGHVTPGDILSNRVVVARHPATGEEWAVSYVTPETEAAQIAEYRRQFPDAEVSAGGPELEADVLARRRASAGAAPAADPELLAYAHERQQFYAEQAQSAKDPVARQAAQANADEYAADIARMEGREPHHSEFQPRTSEGKFDGPPRSLPSRVLNTASDIINAPKSIKSSLALHGPFRQGVFQAAAHPTFLQDAITQQVKSFTSEGAFRDFAQSLTEKPWYQPMQDAGLFMPSTYDVEMGGRAPAWLREERFASAAAERIPGVRASSRAYSAAMDSIRSQAVEHYLTTLYGSEMDLSKADPETLKALAEFVNVSTGRGRVPILDRFDWGRKAVAAANNILWSPRAMASRFNLASPYRLVANALNPATRPVAALQAADSMRAALTVGGSLAMLSLIPGVKVGFNPYKSGWGMVKVGNTQYDLLDGVPSTVKAAAQAGQAFYRYLTGKPPVVRHGQEQTVYNLATDFLRKRLSPSGQFAAEYLTGKDAMGDKVSGSQMASDLLTPFTLEEMYKAWVDAGGSSVGDTLQGKGFKTGFKGAAKGLPSAVGIPTRTYQKRGEPLDLSDIAEP